MGDSVCQPMQDDDRAAVQELVARQSDALHRFLASRLRSALVEVPDLVQEVFLRFLRVNRRESVKSPEAYLFGIARHVLHEHRSLAQKRPDTIEIDEVLGELELPGDFGPERQLQ